ncbi:hypothetical protein LXM50_04465 [Microbacterium sp. Au-Mic1]|uniref:hypothetical protein n=1 Tax=Microbacterium sp. Au-Mic1 TaxID=2906457 RepID=UPI001E40D68C|nr:hypothetical protein [Microbacterium sp. Au-Mic1]MCE4025216.1 hypothetical protein [Microbacterium sp. Au-Mic1]
MTYFIIVIGQTVVLPLVSGLVELIVVGGDPILVFGKWWAFWGVGTRLLAAGIAQMSGKGQTAQILGSTAPSVQEQQLTRELGAANTAMGLAGLLALVPGWVLPAALAGGVFLLIAGLMHLPKKGKNAQEAVATWTDLVVGVAVVVLATRVIIGAITG